MAKELPYFKFEPNQWENGNIQICNREDKGLFIDLCSMYWSRLGDLPLKLALQKLCGGNAAALDSLIKEEIFKVIDGMICIDFLNEQLSEFENISNINSENARIGWEKRRKNAAASNPQSESDAIRGEESKKDKKKEDKKRKKVLMSEATQSDMSDKNKDYFEYASAFYKLFTENSEKLNSTWMHLKRAKAEDFVNHIRLMFEQDKRNEEDLRIVWKFLSKDFFWMKNIQSTDKLRKQFDRLITESKNEKSTTKEQQSKRTDFIKSIDPNYQNR